MSCVTQGLTRDAWEISHRDSLARARFRKAYVKKNRARQLIRKMGNSSEFVATLDSTNLTPIDLL